jgi:hypothetical protein
LGPKIAPMTFLVELTHWGAAEPPMGVPSARRELLRLMNFAEAVDQHRSRRVIKAKLVFDEEDNRLMVVATYAQELLEQLEKLRELSSPEALASIGPVPVERRPWWPQPDV